MNLIHYSALTAGVALVLAGAMSTANAQTAYLDQKMSGAGVCAAALPAFEGLVRKRPRAIQNEGTSTAFVTCAPPQFDGDAGDPDYGIQIQLINIGTTAVTVDCTGVSEIGEELAYVARSASVAGGSSTVLTWHENQGDSGAFTTVSCALPPGAGIGTIFSLGGLVQLPPA